MNTKHTTGPWQVVDRYPYGAQVTSENGYVCRVSDDGRKSTQQEQANARLIAAAPDLLAALDELIGAIYEGKYVDPYSDVYRDALNAIAKATQP